MTLILALVLLFALLWYLALNDLASLSAALRLSRFPDRPPLTHNPGADGQTQERLASGNNLLGVFSEILVVSRPSRLDRRATMERLRLALGVPWTYIDAVSYDDAIIRSIASCVTSIRAHTRSRRFRWPVDWDHGTSLRNPSEMESTSFPCHPPTPDSLSTPYTLLSSISSDASPSDVQSGWVSDTVGLPANTLTCARNDSIRGVKFRDSLPSFMLLTPGKLACWYSHLIAMRRIAEHWQRSDDDLTLGGPALPAFLVLEDDVDMEQGISEQLSSAWTALPKDWDIVYLGHCWSDESHNPAILQADSIVDDQKTRLHPSFAPRCTHAYALNPRSAHRLLRHLTFPPFAYSRALDQALAWLIQSKRVKAFSLVPSLVVQYKVTESDIDQGANGTGSSWRDRLANGLLGHSNTS
ncbi:hypothetical protein PYCCODRAFT_1432275 [Trametes coccinea BRFM310]|uniref:Glycosyltransferase family 25 protein n=1 Tax=Trametes coccinea (strain BRFM310) TaxID=1353009 RepID=A0A1Y2IX60_TRAC3|nr:hypothetical protein PYCCODRAFT_1432275 [Trametes coccinea BRFM310]